MQLIDSFLNRITMYRLVVYVLAVYAGLSVVFAFLGKVPVSPTELVVSLLLLIVSAFVTDRAFGYYFKVPTNAESALITALILFLIIHPENTVVGGIALVVAGAVSSASKFLLTYQGKHIFNPAAFAAAVVTLTGLQATTWWIGSSMFWPVTLVLGLLVVRKIRRIPLFITFVVVGIILQLLLFLHAGKPFAVDMQHALLASPLIFLSTIMLTEPATMPPRRTQQIVFAAIVAFLYVTAWSIGPLTIYPEVALLLGNIYAFVVSPKLRLQLKLQEVQIISERVRNYVFSPNKAFSFLPGQYMDLTLAGVPYDARGNRRTFTIASSPEESTVQIGVKFYEPASAYKATLDALRPGDVVFASQLAGNFTIENTIHKKLVFIAGGIGITPFRSMVQSINLAEQSVNIVLLYVAREAAEFAYMDVFTAARSRGVKTLPIVTSSAANPKGTIHGKLSSELIARAVPDYAERIFYISGPDAMVDATTSYLVDLGIHRKQIKTDHFSGY